MVLTFLKPRDFLRDCRSPVDPLLTLSKTFSSWTSRQKLFQWIKSHWSWQANKKVRRERAEKNFANKSFFKTLTSVAKKSGTLKIPTLIFRHIIIDARVSLKVFDESHGRDETYVYKATIIIHCKTLALFSSLWMAYYASSCNIRSDCHHHFDASGTSNAMFH